ncbi:DUF551 domain-containing protein [Salmonella enterica]|nr:DUF551 domain-containing protein [Salmonella enterica]
MTTLTDKELIKEIKERISSLDVRDNIERRAYEIALASLEAEPIGFRCRRNDNLGDWSYVYHREPDDFERKHLVIEGIYAAPPAPVVPEEATPENVEMLSGYVSTYKLTDSERDIAAEIWNACRAAMLQSGNFRENKNSSTNNFREIAETSTNYPAIPSEVLSAILKVARIRADFDDFDGDRRGIGDCLDEAEQELIVTINKYASQLAAEPIAANDVREQQTAVPPVPEIQADVAQAIENLKQKLVECNRYNYCADAVKGVEDACRAVSYSQADNQPASGNQAAESNRDNEWTGNPDIDNAIIMLDRIDTLENCDDDRIEAVKAVLRRLAGNYPVIPDGWISCSERMPENIPGSCKEYLVFDGLNNKVHHDYWVVPDGDSAPVASFWNHYGAHVTHWMPLPEPPQEVNRG